MPAPAAARFCGAGIGRLTPGLRRKVKLNADRPIPPQISAFHAAFSLEKPLRRAISGLIGRKWPPAREFCSQTLMSAWDLVRCHGNSSVKRDFDRPTGTVLHHLVTALSVKKALTKLTRIEASRRAPGTAAPRSCDASGPQSGKKAKKCHAVVA